MNFRHAGGLTVSKDMHVNSWNCSYSNSSYWNVMKNIAVEELIFFFCINKTLPFTICIGLLLCSLLSRDAGVKPLLYSVGGSLLACQLFGWLVSTSPRAVVPSCHFVFARSYVARSFFGALSSGPPFFGFLFTRSKWGEKWLWMMMVNLSVHIGWWRPRIHISKPLDLNDRVVRVRLYNRSNFKTYSDNLVAGIFYFYFFKLQLYLFYFLAYFVYSFIFFDSSLAVHCFE